MMLPYKQQKIYLAGPFKHRADFLPIRKRLQKRHEVTARWLDIENPQGGEAAQWALHGSKWAEIDLTDIRYSDTIICAPFEGSISGGMHFEMGYAYAYNKRLCIVGNRINVFYYLPTVSNFDTWDECFQQWRV